MGNRVVQSFYLYHGGLGWGKRETLKQTNLPPKALLQFLVTTEKIKAQVINHTSHSLQFQITKVCCTTNVNFVT